MFKLEHEKKAHTLKISILLQKYSKTLLEIEKEFYLLFWENINSFLRQVHKYIFQKYYSTERRAHLLVAVVRIGRWVGHIKSEHCSNYKKRTN